MPSKVLTGDMQNGVGAVHWLTAMGEPVNAVAHREEFAKDSSPGGGAGELESALQRVQVLEKRIQELEAELPRRQERGRAEGRAEGEKAGAAAANSAVKAQLDKLAGSIGELATYRARFRRDSEPELLTLALAVAKKILKRELTVDPYSLLGIVKAALETINKAEVLCIRMAPEDAGIVSAEVGKLGLPDRVEVAGDRTLQRGSVVIQTARGQIDASIQTQLAEIENGFADRISAHLNK